MFKFILLSLTLAYAAAFVSIGRSTISRTLIMGSLPETFKFKKIMNRFTFKTLAEAIETAGLFDALSGGKLTIFAPTDAAFAEYFDTTKQTKEAFLVHFKLLSYLLPHI